MPRNLMTPPRNVCDAAYEQPTSEFYKDGKRIYKRTYTGTTSGNAVLDTNLSSFAGTVVRVEGVARKSGSPEFNAQPFSTESGAWSFYARVLETGNGTLTSSMLPASVWAGWYSEITLYYTKKQ